MVSGKLASRTKRHIWSSNMAHMCISPMSRRIWLHTRLLRLLSCFGADCHRWRALCPYLYCIALCSSMNETSDARLLLRGKFNSQSGTIPNFADHVSQLSPALHTISQRVANVEDEYANGASLALGRLSNNFLGRSATILSSNLRLSWMPS